MASIHKDKKTGIYNVHFRFGKQYKRSLKTRSKGTAQAHVARIEETIRLVRSGRIEIPEAADVAEFIMSDGKLESSPTPKRIYTLSELFETYKANIPEGAKEPSTLMGERRHMSHFLRVFRGSLPVSKINVSKIGEYIAIRSKEKWGEKLISPETIKKELTTFRMIWNWAKDRELVSGPSPTKRAVLPRIAAKPRFMTKPEIERCLTRGGLSIDEKRAYWGSLFLSMTDVREVLEIVQKIANFEFIYPMFVFAAHTGARRSEIMRSRIDDLDFRSGIVMIREKKRVRTKSMTFRHVEMSSVFVRVMQEWLDVHPGGPHTICSARDQQLTNDQASHHLTYVLKKTKWSCIRGFHVFRHSFASNLAMAGVDERIIDEWMGHQTQEMRRRYRHLFPSARSSAIEALVA